MAAKEKASALVKQKGMMNKNNAGTNGAKMGKGSVNNATTRNKTAPTPRSLGPRTA